METVDKLIKLTCNDNQPGIDNIDDKIIWMAVVYIARLIYHILNTSLKQSIFPQALKEAKVIPLPKEREKKTH